MALASIVAAALALSPIIFVSAINDEKAIARPLAKGMLGLSLKDFNEFRLEQSDIARYSGDYCFLEMMRSDAIVSANRDVQLSIVQDHKAAPISYDMQVKGDIRLSVGIYDKCQRSSDTEKLTGSVVVATRQGKLLWTEEYDVLPALLLPTVNSALARIGFCYACGGVSELYYDPANNKFYTEYIGD